MAVKVTPVLEEPTLPCKEANEALTFAIVGLFCCSLIFGPIAISKASQAKKLIQADSRLAGAEKANAAMITGIISIVLAVLNIISRAAHTKGL